MNERRQHVRLPLDRPITVLPVLPDGSPDPDHRCEGRVLDISRGGMQVRVVVKNGLSEGQAVAVGVERAEGGVAYEGMVIRHLRPGAGGQVALGGPFDGQAHRLLEAPRRLPVFQPDRLSYDLPLPQESLDRWAKVGVLRPVLLDRVDVCPRCGGLPTFRGGCRSCGSGRVVTEQLIHHFACGHVEAVGKFDQHGELVCPKCRTRKLVVGSDYEYLHTYRCLDCEWSDWEPQRIGHCLRCGHRFPAFEAAGRDLVGYDADRLDVLALVPAP